MSQLLEGFITIGVLVLIFAGPFIYENLSADFCYWNYWRKHNKKDKQ